jgi:hypothetical protein
VIRFAADENFNNVIMRSLIQRMPDLDIVRVQDSEIAGADDPTVLAWIAKERRILLTHDVKTMTKFAYQRIAAGLPMPGVIEVDPDAPIGVVIEHLLIAAGASTYEDWENKIDYFPMK